MRVTQSMLSSNLLRNLNTNYSNMSKLQDQMNTGRKITRASQDPVTAVKGMQYRVQEERADQFKRNMNEVESWLETTDIAFDQVGNAFQRVKELTVQAASDTYTLEDRQKIAIEIDQIRQQIQDVANTQLGERYIFSGTKSKTRPFVNNEPNPALYLTNSSGQIIDANGNVYNPDATPYVAPQTESGTTSAIEVEVFDGITIPLNTTEAVPLFNNIDRILAKLSSTLQDPNKGGEDIGNFLGDTSDGSQETIADLHEDILLARADIGARMNRVELLSDRLDVHEINVKKLKSENEDIDYAETITQMASAESIHQASLSVGAKIIQQTLVDFIR